ncbi:Nif3-like dinuclear metal center hexameric protein, partial [candidate division KSB1 bacterium]|nr:Nif3-like dinuclear metal center hexameric protein [candidate division KSB1 bacterium]
KRLNLQVIEPVDVGFLGELAHETPFPKFVKTVEELLQTSSFSINYGAASVKKVLVISGGSSFEYMKAIEKGADTFLAGDIRENLVREIEENKLNFINAGHYNTEKLGIQALGEKLTAQFSIPCEFIDIPNPV